MGACPLPLGMSRYLTHLWWVNDYINLNPFVFQKICTCFLLIFCNNRRNVLRKFSFLGSFKEEVLVCLLLFCLSYSTFLGSCSLISSFYKGSYFMLTVFKYFVMTICPRMWLQNKLKCPVFSYHKALVLFCFEWFKNYLNH